MIENKIVTIALPKGSNELRKLIIERIQGPGLDLVFEEESYLDALVKSVFVPTGSACIDAATGKDISGTATAFSVTSSGKG